MTIYLAGKMTGESDYNKPVFDQAKDTLSSLGETVFSPADMIPPCDPESVSKSEYLHICFAIIDICDAVFFLKGWEESEGARKEMAYALQYNKDIIMQE